MVRDITKAFRAKSSLSLNDDIYVFTGDVDPNDASVPSVPYGSLYIRTGTSSGVFEYTVDGWIDLTACNGTPGYTIYGMSSKTASTPLVFTITGMTNGSYYFMSVRRPMTIEIRGVNGRMRMYDASGSYYVLGGAARASNNMNTSWPILYNLNPGVYALGPTGNGTITLSIYGYTGPEPLVLDTSFTATTVVDNGIFLWNGTSYIAGENY